MVTIINDGRSLKRATFYNENKVEKKVASCLFAQNFPLPASDLSPDQRFNYLEKIASNKPNVKNKCLHISLNFAPGEAINKCTQEAIAKDYMDMIGFGNQPYIVYEHLDAGHPHLHIVTTTITPQGKYINTHNIAKYKSEPARKIIEEKYNLIKAESRKQAIQSHVNSDLETFETQVSEIVKTIRVGLNRVIKNYNFASIGELNAVLSLYNIGLTQGTAGTRTSKHDGILYQLLKNDKPLSKAIKASLIDNKVTLKGLQPLFVKGKSSKQQHALQLRNIIDFILKNKRVNTLQKLKEQLKSKNVGLVLRTNENGQTYGLTYVDQNTKCVFNGSELGKLYSANGIAERCRLNMLPENKNTEKEYHSAITAQQDIDHNPSLISTLLRAEFTEDSTPYELSGNKRRRKKKRGHTN